VGLGTLARIPLYRRGSFIRGPLGRKLARGGFRREEIWWVREIQNRGEKGLGGGVMSRLEENKVVRLRAGISLPSEGSNTSGEEGGDLPKGRKERPNPTEAHKSYERKRKIHSGIGYPRGARGKLRNPRLCRSEKKRFSCFPRFDERRGCPFATCRKGGKVSPTLL